MAHLTATLPACGAGVDDVVVKLLERGDAPCAVCGGAMLAWVMLVVQLRGGQMLFGTPATVQLARK
ncbi:MAG: hypothetical protein WC588_03610, partial [Candidatus Micrarchaeia archaeon]